MNLLGTQSWEHSIYNSMTDFLQRAIPKAKEEQEKELDQEVLAASTELFRQEAVNITKVEGSLRRAVELHDQVLVG